MANHRAIKVVCEGVLGVLKGYFDPADFNNTQFQFKVYLAEDFTSTIHAGITLFLYRVFPNTCHRTPAGGIGSGGGTLRTKLPVDLHFLLTAWGKEASLQHTITGWMMRVLEDTPVIPHGLLDGLDPGVFEPDETVEICLGELKNEDMVSLWRDLITTKYRLSIPYVARNIRIDSTLIQTPAEPIQERVFQWLPGNIPASGHN